ncbi:hypothetical protein VTO73DRAFT_14837 [Trametes versicolor]
MPFFTRRYENREATTRRTGGFRARFGRKDPDRVAGGYKAALANPNTTRTGRKRAEHELKAMVCPVTRSRCMEDFSDRRAFAIQGRGDEAHVPFMTKVKRTLGIRSTPRRERTHRSSRTLRRRV